MMMLFSASQHKIIPSYSYLGYCSSKVGQLIWPRKIGTSPENASNDVATADIGSAGKPQTSCHGTLSTQEQNRKGKKRQLGKES